MLDYSSKKGMQQIKARRLDSVLSSDECENSPGVYGECDLSLIPDCSGQQLCLFRKTRRDKFFPDKNPFFYIQYDRVQCVPLDENCSMCSPGRYCESENRCILDDGNYDCSQWA